MELVCFTPGSHRVGDAYAGALNKLGEVGVEGKDVPCAALETTAGDVVVFNHNCKHAAFGGGGRRRMFTLNACQRYPAGREADLRAYMAGIARFFVGRPPSRFLGP